MYLGHTPTTDVVSPLCMFIPPVLAIFNNRAVTYVLKPEALPASKAGNSQTTTHGDRRQHGFIAQEVEQVAPEVVAEDSKGYKTVAYSRLVPALSTALSAALDRLDRLEEAPASTSLPASTITADDVYEASGTKDAVFHEEGHVGQLGSKPPVSDLMQLSEENHKLRARVEEMEKRMADLERSLAGIANLGWPHESD